VWLNNLPLPEDYCGNPEPACKVDPNKCPDLFKIWKYGFYRKLNDNRYEWIAFCNPLSSQYGITFNTQKFKEILDANLPEKKK